MRKSCIKIFSFMLCLLMLTALATLYVGATEYEEEYVPVEWTMDENAEYLYADGKRYERYYANGRFYGDAMTSFYFMNYVEFQGNLYEVYGESATPHIVSVLQGNGYSYVFADGKGIKMLDGLVNRTDCLYHLEYYNSYTVIDEEIVEALDEEYYDERGNFIYIDVSELKQGIIYELNARDHSGMKAAQHGAVYSLPGGTRYYICFGELDNSYFDIDGYFSYRRGTVKALVLDDVFNSHIDEEIDKMSFKEQTYIYESNVVEGYTDIYGNTINDFMFEDGSYSEQGAVAVVFVTTIFTGIIVPIPLLILGLVFGSSKKTGKAKCWYALSASAAVWLVAAIIFLILLII